MNVFLWVAQAVLAAVFGLTGAMHATQPKEKLRPMAPWVEDFTLTQIRLIGAVEQHIDSTRAMELRSAAMWVAENRLAELEVGAAGGDRVTMLDTNWTVATTTRTTDDPDVLRVRIAVTREGDRSSMATLDGFLDRIGSARP